MVAKLKFESKYGQREVKIKVKEKSLAELLAKPNKIEWILDEFMRKSERLTGIEESEWDIIK
nr:MAG TPA: hypothetical protein [Microviridae sp.]